jgi:hypothetical protein
LANGPLTVDEVLLVLLADLLRDPGGNRVVVPAERTCRILADINAACARNMRAAGVDPLSKKA